MTAKYVYMHAGNMLCNPAHQHHLVRVVVVRWCYYLGLMGQITEGSKD